MWTKSIKNEVSAAKNTGATHCNSQNGQTIFSTNLWIQQIFLLLTNADISINEAQLKQCYRLGWMIWTHYILSIILKRAVVVTSITTLNRKMDQDNFSNLCNFYSKNLLLDDKLVLFCTFKHLQRSIWCLRFNIQWTRGL